MGAKKHGVSPKKFTRHPHKTAKRLAAKKALKASQASKKKK